MTTSRAERRPYVTRSDDVDRQVDQLVQALGTDERSRELIREILTTGALLSHDGASRGDLKVINAALKEMRYAFKVFAAYKGIKKVTVFGSARTKPGDLDYEQARQFGSEIAARNWMVITGAGPGTMAAANEGAGAANSFGVNILLPFEAEPNQFIADDQKLINFKYFFTRKLSFVKEADAFVLLPGGLGTADEAFELLTLMQTGKTDLYPVVLLDAPGGDYWSSWIRFVQEQLVNKGYVSPQDLHLFTATDSVDEAVTELERFYSNYRSLRFVGQRLILRMNRAPDDELLDELNEVFADIVVSGRIDRIEATRAERNDNDEVDAERIAFRFDRAAYGRLRQLVDRLNEIVSAP